MKKKIQTGCKQTSELVSSQTVGLFIIVLIMWLLVYFYMKFKVTFLVRFQTNYSDYNSITPIEMKAWTMKNGTAVRQSCWHIFRPLGGSETSCTHSNAILSSYKVVAATMLTNRHTATSAITWSCVHVHPANVYSPFSSIFGPHQLQISFLMRLCVH